MKKMMEKLFDNLRFVFLTSFVLCFSLFFLDYVAVLHGQSGITFLLISDQAERPNHRVTPVSNSGKTMNFPEKSTTSSDISDPVSTSGVPDTQTDTVTENENPIGIEKQDWDPCRGKYIYMYDLPSRFNEDLLKRCHTLMKWMDMCPYMTNLGLGPKITLTERSEAKVLLLKNRWYATNQFSLEVIFHNKMKHYRCLTKNSSLASAVLVPYYAGLDVGQYLWDTNVSVRDASPIQLSKWLSRRPEWKRMWGRDHFLVGGRIGWDFRRRTEDDSDWGTKLMFLPQFSNMTFLPIESGSYPNDFPIPYPTYFHPLKDHEVLKWQKRMKKVKRPYLFSFVGAPRPNSTQLIRKELIKQCLESSKTCKFLGCYDGDSNPCEDPVSITKVFQSSHFCLQPPGDSFTRRSTFDSILTGCIPVFFHPSSAYDQYLWHLPKAGSTYSVFIPEEDVIKKRVKISDTLLRVSKSEVMALREEVIKLIPRIIYGHPKSRFETIEDAFDIAVKEILTRVEKLRKEIFNVNI
ncbi:probable xyloglucan galactosyltransferase GT12 [Neltuma alba]|uniref:probable xyloglucan galactosyltransferase GT12 n=1 Tax=Neltuma alba TaxID=207710 RepID=UPI0010A4C8DC|nr:probable xyloglucan galactosyltransferase GT12 [Prosopis alba]